MYPFRIRRLVDDEQARVVVPCGVRLGEGAESVKVEG